MFCRHQERKNISEHIHKHINTACGLAEMRGELRDAVLHEQTGANPRQFELLLLM